MHKAHKIQLSPTKAQEIFFKKSCGVARFSFNWALDKWKTDYANGIKQSAYTLIKHLNSIKKTEFKWMQETGKCAPQYAIHNVEAAWQNKTVIIADRFFASSKTCSCCGLKKEKLNLSERTFCCLSCGLTIDRDLNAAINLANYSPTSKGEGSKACGERVVETQNTSVKHEIVNKIENYSQFNTL